MDIIVYLYGVYTDCEKKKDDISAYPWIDKTSGCEKRVDTPEVATCFRLTACHGILPETCRS